ncbi:two-component system, OmpR family, sensor histidine kinase RstB [Nannocystis exedens]|uniref:histidine kinase n=1 Tax=Nannocystis exedens TaxID=54 RepID=A0A1I2G0P7_9BACT|nr:ATP-binding protein [Nannocystis exedens]PCC74594.1 two-component sensor histidine kinase [Nannocystis exedens]SFF10689.1 two-component system, OmpR family, sensor histidine kinase RstB [Nannocystis exedens]
MNNLFVRFYVGVVAALALALILLVVAAAGRRETVAEREDQDARLAEHYVALTQGNHWLMQEALLDRPPAEWDAIVERWRPHFRYPIELRSAREVLAGELPPFVRERVAAGEAAAWSRVTHATSERLSLYLPLAGTDRVLVQELELGPPVDVLLELIGVDVMVLLAILGLTILALTRPLARHVTRLAEAARAFGSGQLNARVPTTAPEPIGRLARTFNAMAERIQRASDAQQATLQAISHELRTPIVRLHFALEVAGSALAEVPAARDHLEAMARDVGEIEALVEELLIYARLQPGAPPLELAPLDLAEVVRDVVRDLGPLAPALPPVIEGPASAPCMAHERHLARAVSNLLRNAQRHARAQIRVRFDLTDAFATVSVDDDGPGIPEDQRARVFLPFERLDASRNRATGGYGLGLAIVHRVMQAHGGSARAESSELGGARLILTWPRGAEAA